MIRYLSFVLLILFSLASRSDVIEMNNEPINEFIYWASDVLDKPVLPSGNFDSTISVKADIQFDQVKPFIKRVLQVNGYYLHEYPDVYTVVKTRAFDVFEQPLENRVYELQNISTQQASSIVQQFIDQQRISYNDKGSLSAQLFSVASVPNRNSLSVSLHSSLHDRLTDVLAKVDKPVRQVLIEAVLVESSLTDSGEYGVDWSLIEDGVVRARLDLIGDVEDGLTLVQNGALTGIVRMLEGQDNSKVLSTPSLIVKDGHTGSIVVGQNVPFITGSTTGEANGSDNPFQTIERRDVGITLTVAPNVLGDSIQLNIRQEASNVSSSVLASDIITNTRTIATDILIKAGEVVRLGGLIREDETEATKSVPVLGDFPVVGAAFRSKSQQKLRSKLDVLLTARLI